MSHALRIAETSSGVKGRVGVAVEMGSFRDLAGFDSIQPGSWQNRKNERNRSIFLIAEIGESLQVPRKTLS